MSVAVVYEDSSVETRIDYRISGHRDGSGQCDRHFHIHDHLRAECEVRVFDLQPQFQRAACTVELWRDVAYSRSEALRRKGGQRQTNGGAGTDILSFVGIKIRHHPDMAYIDDAIQFRA